MFKKGQSVYVVRLIKRKTEYRINPNIKPQMYMNEDFLFHPFYTKIKEIKIIDDKMYYILETNQTVSLDFIYRDFESCEICCDILNSEGKEL